MLNYELTEIGNKILKNINLFNQIRASEYSNSKIITRVSELKQTKTKKLMRCKNFGT